MARIRSIKPEACIGERIGAVSSDAERLFWRLQTHCDDHGRCQDEPRVIHGACVPMIDGWTADLVDTLLWELAEIDPERPLIWRYTDANGRPLVQVNEWTDYQKPQHPGKSKFDEFDSSRRRFPEGSCRSHEGLTTLTVRSGYRSGEVGTLAEVGGKPPSVDNHPDVSELIRDTKAAIGRPLTDVTEGRDRGATAQLPEQCDAVKQ